MSRLAVLCLLLPTAALAQAELSLRELMHARDFAMGGAYRAHGLGGEAILGNPAALSLYRRYQLELSGAWDAQSKFGFGTVSVLDSVTSELAAGVSYYLVSAGRADARSLSHLSTLALSMPLSSSVLIGASTRHVLVSGAYETNGVTMDAGVLVRALDALVLGFSGHNLIDLGNPMLERYYALSLAFLGGLFTAAADLKGDVAPEGGLRLAYSGGVEYVAGGGFPVRAGYTYDARQGRHHLSAGVGVMVEGGGLDLGYRHELGGEGGRLIALTFRLQLR
ncbi:MAG: hypothetical protein HYZ28_06380 [Myxococcales bacterium]|nr:hypothetical protein [Myxococcales bacterium]